MAQDFSQKGLENLLIEMDKDPENDPEFHENYEYWNGYLEAISRIKKEFSL